MHLAPSTELNWYDTLPYSPMIMILCILTFVVIKVVLIRRGEGNRTLTWTQGTALTLFIGAYASVLFIMSDSRWRHTVSPVDLITLAVGILLIIPVLIIGGKLEDKREKRLIEQ